MAIAINCDGVKDATKNLNNLSGSAEKAENSASNLEQALRLLSPSSIMAVAGITAVVSAVQKLVGLGSAILNVSSSFENVKTGLKTATGSAKEAETVFEQIRKLSYETTFGMEELSQAATYLLNAGQGTNQINKTLLMLGNLAQGDKIKFLELSDIYTKVLNIGKANSLQINQLAIRGIPIKQTLQEIGVQGTATAEEFTLALQKMTDEGGKFAGAMDNLNDTIAGKEDFVSDTLKEIAVNFGELSGLTDTYKTVLEGLRNALDKVNNVLIEINKNPVAKAIFAGTVSAVMTGLVVTIGVGIVGAIAQVNAMLAKTVILKSILDPKTLGIALLVGGIAGIALALNDMGNEAEEAGKKMKEALSKPATASDFNEEKREWYSKNIDNAKGQISQINSQIEQIQGLLANSKGPMTKTEYQKNQGLDDRWVKNNQAQFDNMYATYLSTDSTSVLQNQLGILNQQKTEQERILELNEKWNNDLDELENSTKLFSNMDSSINNLISGVKSTAEKELESLESQLKQFTDIQNVNNTTGWTVQGDDGISYIKHLPDDLKASLDYGANIIKAKIEQAKVKVIIDNGADWQKELQSVLGLSDSEATDLSSGTMLNGKSMVDVYNQKWDKYISNPLGDTDNKTLEYLNSATKAVEQISKSNLNLSDADKFTRSDNSVNELLNNISTRFNTVLEPMQMSGIEVADMNEQQKASVSSLLGVYSSLKNLLGETDPLIQQLNDKLRDAGIPADGSNPTGENKEDAQLTDITSIASEFFTDAVPKLVTQIGENIGEAFESGDFSDALNGTGDIMNNFGSKVSFAGMGIGMLLQAISQFISSVNSKISEYDQYSENGVDNMNPFDKWLDQFAELFKSFNWMTSALNDGIFEFLGIFKTILNTTKPAMIQLMIIIKIIGKIIGLVGKVISAIIEFCYKIGDVMSFGIWGKLEDLYDTTTELNDAQEEEAERLRSLNDAYSSLYDALKEQEEYYLEKKSEIRGQSSIDNAYKVNDMILTPNGTFSTHPDDTIMAMKHPEDLLGSRNASVIVNINNQAGVEVTSSQTTDSNGNTVIDFDIISARVASDYMTGQNGWDSAITQQQYSQTGRILAL